MTKKSKNDVPMMAQVVLPRIIYVMHYAQPISPAHTTQHYIGSCKMGRMAERMAEHKSGIRQMHIDRKGNARWTGAPRLSEVAVERGIAMWPVLAFVDHTGGYGEHLLKSKKRTPCFCPACSAEPVKVDIQDLEEISVQEALEMERTSVTLRRRKQAARQAQAFLHTGVMQTESGLYMPAM